MKILIKIGKCTIYLLCPLFATIFWVLRALLLTQRNNSNFNEFKSPLFFSFFSIVIYIFGGILELFSKCFFKKNRINNESVKNQIMKITRVRLKLEYLNIDYNYVINLLLFAIVNCISYPFAIMFSHYARDTTVYNEMKVGHILMDAFLSLIILRYSIFKHQILSLIIIVFGLILIFYQNLLDYPLQCFLCLLVYFFYAFPDVQLKKVTNSKLNSIFIIMFYEGILMLIIYLIIAIILMFIPSALKVSFLVIPSKELLMMSYILL